MSWSRGRHQCRQECGGWLHHTRWYEDLIAFYQYDLSIQIWLDFLCLVDMLVTQNLWELFIGDQVSKKGGMTGGFYDFRRSKLKLMSMIRECTVNINMKQAELEQVRTRLQDILTTNLWQFSFYLHILEYCRSCISRPLKYVRQETYWL